MCNFANELRYETTNQYNERTIFDQTDLLVSMDAAAVNGYG